MTPELKQYLSPDMLDTWHRLVDGARRVVLISHSGPDGDAMGSLLSLAHYLRQQGKKAVPMVPNAFPDFLRWMPGCEQVVIARNHPQRAIDLLRDADLVMCLDFNNLSRIDELETVVESLHTPLIHIDHHLDPTVKANVVVSDPDASATCEIMFCLLHQLGAYDTMTPDIARCLYCGLMTDTGCFAYNSNHPQVFQIVSMLVAKNIDKDQIYRDVYYSFSESRLRLMGHILKDNMIYMARQHAAIYSLTADEMKQYDFSRGDAEGFVNLPLQIKGTKLSIALREDTEKDVIRVSLRSVGDMPCNEMAARYFNGGGHKNASGGSLPLPMSQAVETARQAIEAYSDMLV